MRNCQDLTFLDFLGIANCELERTTFPKLQHGGSRDGEPSKELLSPSCSEKWGCQALSPAGRKALREKCAFPLNKKINLEKKCVLENIYLPAK